MSASNSPVVDIEPRRSSLEYSRTHNGPASPIAGSSSQFNQTSAKATPLDHETFLKHGSGSGSSTSRANLSNPQTTHFNCAPTQRNTAGHNSDYAKFDLNGKNVIHHENIYLKPVYRTTVRHIEIEEVERVTTIERHIHHIQYHAQGVVNPEPVAIVDRHSYYELVDPTLNITQSEPTYHAPVEHKLKYQPVTKEEFINSGSAIRQASERDHHAHHVSIGGTPKPLAEGQTQDSLTSRYISSQSSPIAYSSTTAGLDAPATSNSNRASSGTIGKAL